MRRKLMQMTQGGTYKQNCGCGEDKEDLRLELRVDQALGVDLSLLQTEQSHELYGISA